MSLVLGNQGEQIALEALVNKTAPQTLVLRLYTNDYTPVEASVEGSFTEASGNGYAAINLTPASNWAVTPGAPTDAAFPQQVFTFTGPLGNVFGYYITQVTSGKHVWGERFTDGPYNIVNNGDQIKITLHITLE